MTKKKTCDRCKASKCEPGWGYSCSLGYEVDISQGTPKEPCPKPLTFERLFAAQKKGRQIG